MRKLFTQWVELNLLQFRKHSYLCTFLPLYVTSVPLLLTLRSDASPAITWHFISDEIPASGCFLVFCRIHIECLMRIFAVCNFREHTRVTSNVFLHLFPTYFFIGFCFHKRRIYLTYKHLYDLEERNKLFLNYLRVFENHPYHACSLWALKMV